MPSRFVLDYLLRRFVGMRTPYPAALPLSAISRASSQIAQKQVPIRIRKRPLTLSGAKSLSMVGYKEFLDCARQQHFVQDPDAAVKAVCGILASRFEEGDARKFTSKLPQPLTTERLRGHQANPPEISVEDAASTLVQQFQISPEQAAELFRSLTHFARNAVGREVFEKAAQSLPRDWAELLTT